MSKDKVLFSINYEGPVTISREEYDFYKSRPNHWYVKPCERCDRNFDLMSGVLSAAEAIKDCSTCYKIADYYIDKGLEKRIIINP